MSNGIVVLIDPPRIISVGIQGPEGPEGPAGASGSVTYVQEADPAPVNEGDGWWQPSSGDYALYIANVWAPVGGGGGIPGGADTQVQYNNGGAFGGMSQWTYNNTTGKISAAANVSGASLSVINANGTAIAIEGIATASGGRDDTTAIVGQISTSLGAGIYGYASGSTGNNHGVHGYNLSDNGIGVLGSCPSVTGTAYGISGEVQSPNAWGGYFRNFAGDDIVIEMAGGDTIIYAENNGQLRFKVDDTGRVSTNKGIDKLGTSTGNLYVDVVSTAPSPGQVLVASSDIAASWQAQSVLGTEFANTGTIPTVDWTVVKNQRMTIIAATTVTFTAPAGPSELLLKIINGGVGAITWPSTVKWPGGTEPTWTTTGTDIVSFYFDGTNYYHTSNSLANA